LEACVCKDGKSLFHILELLLCFPQAEYQLWFFVGHERIARLWSNSIIRFSFAFGSLLLLGEVGAAGPEQCNGFLIADIRRVMQATLSIDTLCGNLLLFPLEGLNGSPQTLNRLLFSC